MLNSDGEHVTRDGEIIPLRDITDSHLVNIINYIEKLSRDGFIDSIRYQWDGSWCYGLCCQEDYVKGDEALSILNYNVYIDELNRRKANGVNYENYHEKKLMSKMQTRKDI